MSLSRKQKKELQKFAALFEFEPVRYWTSILWSPRIAFYANMEIFINPKEKGHNEPHIHVKYQDFKASFSIRTGEIIKNTDSKNTGRLSGKNRREIKNWILENPEWFLGQWNELTDGITFKVKSGATDGVGE